MQRYLILVPWSLTGAGGVNTVIFGLKDEMLGQFQPQVVNTGWQPPGPDELSITLPEPTASARSALGFALRLAPNLVRLFQMTRGTAVVNPHFIGLELLPVALLRALRLCPTLVLSVHGADINKAMQSQGANRSLYRWLFRSADVTIACSEALAVPVRQLSPGANVVAVHNGTSAPPADFGARFISQPYLICIAGFVKKKAHDVLLAAFHRIAQTRGDLKLVLIGGDGPERGNVTALRQSLGLADKVDILTNVAHQDVWRWIHHAECLVLPSRDEPFGIALLEAALVDTPVVATRVGGVPEFVTDGHHGLLCDPDRPDQIAAAVLETLDQPERTRARVEAFHRRASEFTWTRTFNGYKAVAGL